MGFLFNFGVIFIVIPLTLALLVVWLVTRKAVFGKIVLILWSPIIFLILLVAVLRPLSEKIDLEKSDYYGHYTIDRTHFPGTQADWQYNTYRFEITGQDSIFFHVTDGHEIQRTYRGRISTSDPDYHDSERLIIRMKGRPHHVITTNPTTYRGVWDFYLVFNSPKFHNMFFRKGEWEPIDD